MKHEPSERLLRMPEVLNRVGLSLSRFKAAVAQGTFPAPVKIGLRANAWRESEVTEWINTRSKTHV